MLQRLSIAMDRDDFVHPRPTQRVNVLLLVLGCTALSCARMVVPEYADSDVVTSDGTRGATPDDGTSNRVDPVGDARVDSAVDSHGDARTDTLPPSDATHPAHMELCDNGLDDDQDGAVDEDCSCRVGSRHRCFAGATSMAGVGNCGMGTQICVGSGTEAHWTECVGSGAPSSEICDGEDNDCNGMIDETCACDPNVSTSCYGGPPATRDVGPCRAGHTTCEPIPGDVPQGVRCDGMVRPAFEICDGIDNDCNGAIDDILEQCDFMDNDCDGVADDGCVYVGVALTRFVRSGASGFTAIDQGPLYVEIPSSTSCPAGEVPIETQVDRVECVPPPPVCPVSQRPIYVSHWTCVECDMILQLATATGTQRVCVTAPGNVQCPPGMTQMLDARTLLWSCRASCDYTLDRVNFGPYVACVPC